VAARLLLAPLYAGAGVIGVLAFAAVDAVPHTSGVWAPLVAVFFAFSRRTLPALPAVYLLLTMAAC